MTEIISDDQADALLKASVAPRVTKEYIETRIIKSEFFRLTGTLTVCQITLDNGFSLTGESACASPENFNQSLAERYSYEKAFDKLWILFAFMICENRFQHPFTALVSTLVAGAIHYGKTTEEDAQS